MKPKESARCHQTLFSHVGSGDETNPSIEYHRVGNFCGENFAQTATKPQNSLKFSPSKVSHCTVAKRSKTRLAYTQSNFDYSPQVSMFANNTSLGSGVGVWIREQRRSKEDQEHY